MFIVHINYNADLDEIDKYLSQHREFLEEYYQKGMFIASGPKSPRTGGIIIATCDSQAILEEVLSSDPFKLAEIATYEIIEFQAVKYCDEIKDLILKN